MKKFTESYGFSKHMNYEVPPMFDICIGLLIFLNLANICTFFLYLRYTRKLAKLRVQNRLNAIMLNEVESEDDSGFESEFGDFQ
ncbi:unnamed protein product [Caenorhabditis angaria]|uniref:Uncharacterized protein n=1 Tax=Caenorhabditis angaria TaxID=860376 RepID=A0A9P1IEF4_9PELO|nr:unnamed protein product [Caenorhabditis angaria]